MEPAASHPQLNAQALQLRTYRALTNASILLLVVASALLVTHFVFPYLFSVLLRVWTVDALLVFVLAVAWLCGMWAFASGRIKCPACAAPFATGFHFWVPKTCQACGRDVTVPHGAAK